jgi:hypothetical protein
MVARVVARLRVAAVVAVSLALGGCVTSTTNLANPTATEALLRAHAAERACAELNLRLPVGTKVLLQVTAGAGQPGGEYVVAACRAHLAGRGIALISDAKDATDTVELRIAAASIDDVDQVFGLASMTLPPIPGQTATALTTPAISLFSRHQRTAVVEISAIALDAHTGRLVSAVGPLWAATQIRNGTVLTGFSFGPVREHPELLSTSH